MAHRYKPIDLGSLKTFSVSRRQHKSSVNTSPALPLPGATAAELLRSFPPYLGANAFREVVRSVAGAVRAQRPVVAAFGAHVVKVGCAPILVDLMRRGVISAISTNGAGAIHDVELAVGGETSEEVADTIRDGSFGMVEETFEFFDKVSRACHQGSLGLGEAVGRLLIDRSAVNRHHSIFATAVELGVPACVHVALGTDTVHMSPRADGAAIGEASLRDFHLICDVVRHLGGENGSGGVWLNLGSAVVLPEVFLKAVSIARNLGADLSSMVAANFDMIRHYRPHQNVVTRPVTGKRGFEVVGHHEIMLPLLRMAILEELGARA